MSYPATAVFCSVCDLPSAEGIAYEVWQVYVGVCGADPEVFYLGYQPAVAYVAPQCWDPVTGTDGDDPANGFRYVLRYVSDEPPAPAVITPSDAAVTAWGVALVLLGAWAFRALVAALRVDRD